MYFNFSVFIALSPAHHQHALMSREKVLFWELQKHRKQRGSLIDVCSRPFFSESVPLKKRHLADEACATGCIVNDYLSNRRTVLPEILVHRHSTHTEATQVLFMKELLQMLVRKYSNIKKKTCYFFSSFPRVLLRNTILSIPSFGNFQHIHPLKNGPFESMDVPNFLPVNGKGYLEDGIPVDVSG